MENPKQSKKFSRKVSAIRRRTTVITRLSNQLVTGLKTDKEGNKVPLTESDKARINSELNTLNSRI